MTARLHTSSPHAFPDSLSGTRFRIQTHIFIWNLCPSFIVNLWSISVWPLINQITFASANKLSEPVFPRLRLMCAVTMRFFQTSKSYKANLSLLERTQTFHSTLCHIKFSSTQWEEERARAPASVTKPHQGHTNISSVQLLSTLGCISLIMKHYRASLSDELHCVRKVTGHNSGR